MAEAKQAFEVRDVCLVSMFHAGNDLVLQNQRLASKPGNGGGGSVFFKKYIQKLCMRYLLIICSTCDRGRYSQATDISYQYI